MTWAEFKAAVEAAGVKDETKIAWIDIGSNVKELYVSKPDDHEEVTIS